LRFDIVVAAYPEGTLHSSVFARPASGAFYEAIASVISYEVVFLMASQKAHPPCRFPEKNPE